MAVKECKFGQKTYMKLIEKLSQQKDNSKDETQQTFKVFLQMLPLLKLTSQPFGGAAVALLFWKVFALLQVLCSC